MGPSTLNIGVIEGGRAPNVIADAAGAQVLIRLVGPSEETRKAVEQAVAGLAEVEFTLEIPFIRMRQVEGLETMVAAFTTDIPALTTGVSRCCWGRARSMWRILRLRRLPRASCWRRWTCTSKWPSGWRVLFRKMKFTWTQRLKYGVLAGLAGWLAGWLTIFPFELSSCLALCGCPRRPVARRRGERHGGVGRLQPLHGDGGFLAPGAAAVPVNFSALDRALAPFSDPWSGAGGHRGYL